MIIGDDDVGRTIEGAKGGNRLGLIIGGNRPGIILLPQLHGAARRPGQPALGVGDRFRRGDFVRLGQCPRVVLALACQRKRQHGVCDCQIRIERQRGHFFGNCGRVVGAVEQHRAVLHMRLGQSGLVTSQRLIIRCRVQIRIGQMDEHAFAGEVLHRAAHGFHIGSGQFGFQRAGVVVHRDHAVVDGDLAVKGIEPADRAIDVL